MDQEIEHAPEELLILNFEKHTFPIFFFFFFVFVNMGTLWEQKCQNSMPLTNCN